MIVLGLVHYKNMTIVILDTEGLLSLEESGSIFDNQIVTMAVLSSNLVIINHKGEISANLEGLIGMSLYAKIQIQSSPFKPKLLFALRDQAQRDKTSTFQQQLNRLKDNIQRNGQFLRMSIEDELEMKQIVLLPGAYTEDINRDFDIIQKWRTETFAAEIIKFRSTIIKGLEGYMNETSSQEQGIQKTTNNLRNLTRKSGRYLYAKLTTNWKSIDDLGERLLTCQSLYELSIQNELKSLSTNIITEQQDQLQKDGSILIQRVVHARNQQNQLNPETSEDSKPHIWVRSCMEKGMTELGNLVEAHVEQAKIEYEEISKQSVFAKMKSQWNYIGSSIGNMQLYLNEQLEMYAWETSLKTRHDYYRRELMRVKERCTTLNELHEPLNQRVQELEAETRDSLQKYQRSKEDISKTVLDVYRNLLQTKSLKRRKTNIIVCTPIEYAYYHDRTGELSSILNRYLTRIAEPSGIFNSTTSHRPSSSPSDNTTVPESPLALNDKQILTWFTQTQDPTSTIGEAIRSVARNLLVRINDQLNSLPLHSTYSDPRNLDQMIEMIDYELHTAKIDMRELNKPSFIQSVMMLMIHMFIEKTKKKFEERQRELLNETLSDLRRVQQNVVDQMRDEESSDSQAQIFRRILGRVIIAEVLRHYRRKFAERWNSRTLQDLDINPIAVTRSIYRESIASKSIDSNSVLKLVEDPGHYCIEKVYSSIQNSRRQLAKSYLEGAQNQITSLMLIMNDTVLNDKCKDAYALCQHVVNQVCSLEMSE